MSILAFLVSLAGSVMLLLYAVRMVRTGIERSFGTSFRRYVTSATNVPMGSLTGICLAIILQSSAAVGLLVAGFAGSGSLSFASGLPIILGADLGSALLIQVLSFDLQWLTPALLAIGGGFIIKSGNRKLRQIGRIILGIAFILVSLRFLRETMIPIRDSNFLPAIAAYLEQDLVTAFITGAALSFVMLSSVAAILMCVTIVSIDALPLTAGIALVLGANLGSALIPVWLARSMKPQALRLPVANLILRGSFALLALVVFARTPLPLWPSWLPQLWTGSMGNAQALINIHILFNCLLMLALPVCRYLEKPLKLLLPEAKLQQQDNPMLRPALDQSAHDKPVIAIASVRREVLRVAQIIETMVSPVMELFNDFDQIRMRGIRGQDSLVNNAVDNIKRYVASIPYEIMNAEQRSEARDLTEYAIALEIAGDIVGKQLLTLAQEKSQEGVRLSLAGTEELNAMHDQLMSNFSLAMNVLVSNDLDSARLLLEEKTEMVSLERASRKKHLKRLSDGSAVSFDSSNIHLETLRALNQFNSHVASLAYPILYRGGQLLETRLITDLENTNTH